jgi:hypothetical protein
MIDLENTVRKEALKWGANNHSQGVALGDGDSKQVREKKPGAL